MGIRLMAVGTRCLADNLGTKATHLYQQKMTKQAADGDQTDGCRPSADGL